MGVKLVASSGGSVELVPTNTASNFTVTVPAKTGTVIVGSDGIASESQGGTGTTVGYNGFKNRIINGAMVLDQRNAGASITANDNTFAVDRFRFSMTQSSKGTGQQTTTAPAGFNNSLLFTSTAATSLGAGDEFAVLQPIEGYNLADLGWGTASAQTVTVSFWVRSSLTGTFGGSIQNNAGNRSYPFSYTISAANTFEYKTVTIAGDTSGTWLTTNGLGARLRFGLGVGTTGSGTAGAWAAANYQSATGATSVVGTNGATFYITGVQLEKGSTATSFDYRSYGTELALCQRYYYQIGARGAWGGFETTTRPVLYTRHTSQMRASPTVIRLAQVSVGSIAGIQADNGSFSFADGTPQGCTIAFIVASGSAAVGTPCVMEYADKVAFNAEL